MTQSPNPHAKPAVDQKAFQAALYSVRKLGGLASESARSSDAMSAMELERLRGEMRHVRSLLASDELSSPIVDMIETLFESKKSPASWSAQAASLGTVERMIETSMVNLGAPGPTQNAALSSLGQVGATEKISEGFSRPTSASSRDEDALALRASEKFFGSGSVKLLGAAIVTAFAMAGAGSLFIAGQTVFTAKDVRSTADSAIKNINDLVASAKANADQQVELLRTAQRAIADGRTQFDSNVATARSSVQEQAFSLRERANSVKEELTKLKENAVEEVIKKLRADMDENSKPLRTRIEDAANAAATSLTQLGTTSRDPLNQRILELSSKLTADERQLASNKAALDTLDGLARRIDEIKQQIDRAGDYAEAAAKAHSASATATEAATNAQAHREALLNQLEWLDQNIGTQLVLFGATKGKLDDLVRQTATLHPALCDQPSIESNPWAARAQLNCIKERVGALEAQFPAAPIPTQSPIEPPLSMAQWRSIQRALANLNLYRGKIDGNPGANSTTSRTRAAIREWQRTIGDPTTGQLTQAQADRLSRPGQTAR